MGHIPVERVDITDILTTQPDSNIFLKAPDNQTEYKFEIQVSTDKHACDWVLFFFMNR